MGLLGPLKYTGLGCVWCVLLEISWNATSLKDLRLWTRSFEEPFANTNNTTTATAAAATATAAAATAATTSTTSTTSNNNNNIWFKAIPTAKIIGWRWKFSYKASICKLKIRFNKFAFSESNTVTSSHLVAMVLCKPYHLPTSNTAKLDVFRSGLHGVFSFPQRFLSSALSSR